MTTLVPVVAVALATGSILAASRVALWGRLAFLFLYLDIFAAVFFVSVETQASGWAPLVIAAALALGAILFGREWRVPILFVVMGLLVAYYSGSEGSAEPMSGWLFDLGWLSPEFVEGVVIAFRKTIHVVFYGSLAVVCRMVASEVVPGSKMATLAAFGWALSHALFDESRQMVTPGRSGSWWDVLLDSAAMALALAWAIRRTKAKRIQDGPN